jgi:DNA invertase Pin-like site-specific DNA recombinase
MLERTRAGLAAARARGKVSGRPRKLIPADVKRVQDLMQAGELSANEIANLLRVSRATLFRQIRRAREIHSLTVPSKPTAHRKGSRQDSPPDHGALR